MKLYRAFPYDSSAAETDPGGALFVPPASPLGRIANVGLYREVYLADCPEAAISEKFGFLSMWTDDDFRHAGAPYVVTEYELDAAVFDLDDITSLIKLGITKPSTVVTRHRVVTQAWAKTIYLTGAYAGARWWSYYNPQWFSFGLWDINKLRHVGPPQTLSTTYPAVVAAARAIVRQLSP
ncbi:MAG: RES domain-containing protein [Candidatus Tumulicola sp.]